jgi:hypothetical protein
VSTQTGVPAHKLRGFLGVLPYLLDIIVPLVSFYVLTGIFHLSTFWALVIGGGITAVVSLINTIRRGRLDNLGVLVILEIILGLVLDLTVRDARLTLARGSLFIALAGGWTLVNVFSKRPLTTDITKAFAAKKGGREGIIAFEWLAANSPEFLRIQRWLSTVWSLAFIGYAIVRVIVVYNTTISQALWLNEIPGIIAFMIGIAASAIAGKKLEKMVYDRMDVQAGKAPEAAATAH